MIPPPATAPGQVYAMRRRGLPDRHVAVRRITRNTGYPIAWFEEVTRTGRRLPTSADREWIPHTLTFDRDVGAWVMGPGAVITEIVPYKFTTATKPATATKEHVMSKKSTASKSSKSTAGKGAKKSPARTKSSGNRGAVRTAVLQFIADAKEPPTSGVLRAKFGDGSARNAVYQLSCVLGQIAAVDDDAREFAYKVTAKGRAALEAGKSNAKAAA